MATLLGKVFFNKKKTVLQCDDETLGFTAETLIIQFDQEKFEQLLSEGGSNSINERKHKKISVTRSPLVVAQKQVPNGTIVCWPNSSYQHTHTLCVKLNQPLGLFGLKSLHQPPVRLMDLWFQLLAKLRKSLTTRLFQLFTELSFASPAKLKAKHL